MPLIRERVPAQLGISGDCSVDPMTAVAIGAAIFAESRDWSEAANTRKPSRASATLAGPLEVAFDCQARTASEEAIVRVRTAAKAAAGYQLQIDCTDTGWTSGRQGFVDGVALKLPLRQIGENRFRVLVFDSTGRPVESASTQLVIMRTHASARGIPATQNIAVKVRESEFNEQNTLEIFLKKGTELPQKNVLQVRAARSLRWGEAGHIDIELFQQDHPESRRPELNLFIGAFRIEDTDLADGQALRKGDELKFHWRMDEGGILTASAELPSLGLHFEERRFYVPQASPSSFEGDAGTRLAATALDRTEEDLERATEIVGNGATDELERVRVRLARQRDQLEQAFDADGRRSVTEEARRLRQDVDILVHRPEHRAAAMTRELPS